MQDIVTAARQRLAEIRQEAEKLEKFLESAEGVSALLGGKILSTPSAGLTTGGEKESFAAGRKEGADGPNYDPNGPKDTPQPRTRITDNPKPREIVPAAISIIRERGKPMSRRDLHEALAARGLVVRGVDPVKTLGTILWRAKDRMVQIEGKGYWPKADPFPPSDSYDFL